MTPSAPGDTNWRVCAIIPALNASTTVGRIVDRVRQLGLDPIVVNDGTTDATVQAATTAGARVISHVTNQGKGLALRSGFAVALQFGYDVVVTLDSDGQHDPEDIPRLLEACRAQQAPIVIGHRVIDGERMPAMRRWTNRAMSTMVSMVARQSIPDSQCGLRVIRRDVLEALRLTSARFDLETELLLAVAARGWAIRSVPIRTIYHNTHRSHIRPLRDGLRFVGLVARYALWPRRHPGP